MKFSEFKLNLKVFLGFYWLVRGLSPSPGLGCNYNSSRCIRSALCWPQMRSCRRIHKKSCSSSSDGCNKKHVHRSSRFVHLIPKKYYLRPLKLNYPVFSTFFWKINLLWRRRFVKSIQDKENYIQNTQLEIKVEHCCKQISYHG